MQGSKNTNTVIESSTLNPQQTQSMLKTMIRLDSDQTTEIGSNTQEQTQSLNEIPSHISFKNVISKSLKVIDTNFGKFVQFGMTTSNADKMMRMCTSVVKAMKAYGIISKLKAGKAIDKMNGQFSLARKVFRFNSKWITIKQVYELVMKQNRTQMDTFNIWFKLFQLIGDFIDEVIYLIQIQLYQCKHKETLSQTVSNLYFIECIIWLILHSYQYYEMNKNSQKATTQQQQQQKSRKLLTIVKYIMDGMSSHNQFSYKIFTINPKYIGIAGILSSLIGLKLAWK